MSYLSKFLDDHGLSDADFAAQIGVSRVAVSRYRSGARIPARDVMSRIVDATGGAVQPNDFYAGLNSGAAE